MEWFLILLCALIVIAIYLQFMGKFDSSSSAGKKQKSKLKLTGSFEGLKQKICPLCNSELKKGDNLFAEMHEGDGKPKVIINGCKYCYIPKK